MLATAALLASCSQDDALQNTVNNNEGLKPMTITASLPTDGMQTRAAGDAAAARCYVQILDGNGNPLEDGNSDVKEMTPGTDGSFTTMVYLKEGATYDFLFWADTELLKTCKQWITPTGRPSLGQEMTWISSGARKA